MTNNDRSHSALGEYRHIIQRISECQQLELEESDCTDNHKSMDLVQEIDPDNHVFSTIKNDCCYYTNDQYNQNSKFEGK